MESHRIPCLRNWGNLFCMTAFHPTIEDIPVIIGVHRASCSTACVCGFMDHHLSKPDSICADMCLVESGVVAS
jgi:hypothetical protein